MELFRADNITKRYAGHVALRNVSISVEKGSIFGLLGPNGAGKTSLIRIINQITGPDEGEVYFAGERLKPEHVERIGYLPEERGLYKKMKVGEQALYLARLKGLSKPEALKKLKYWFERFEIEAWWNKKVEELSKGMAQKVQFIVTVLHDPLLLILDEPFSGFDPINANIIKEEILKLRDNGATVIFSTHNMGSVEELCDHIALINKSEKILDGPVKDLRNEFKENVFELEFEGQMLKFTNALGFEFELINHTEEDGLTKALIQIKKGLKPNDLLQSVMPAVQVHSLNEVIPSMNDIFIKAVQGRNPELEVSADLTE